MKKIILILTAILIAVYICLELLSSGGEYAAERLFYRATRLNSEIVANPDVAPPQLLVTIENTLQKILQRYPKTTMAKRANITLAEFYILNKKYNLAFSALASMVDKYNSDTGVLSVAGFLKGVAYEKQDRWDMALKEFAMVRDKYTNTELGLQVPIYIGRHYEKEGDSVRAGEAFAEAAAFYENLERSNPRTMIGYMASALSIEAYLGAKNYEKAGAALEEIINKYPSPMTLTKLLPYVDFIFVEKLKRPDRAIEIYKNIKEKSKNEKFSKFLQQKIEKIEKLEGKK